MHKVTRSVVGAACLMLLPTLAFAQATIAGVVKDASGAVLPGVTVEAASPVLIEKVRSAVTDGSGQYRIVDLRPGTYAVTFSLTGFSSVKREGVELTGTFVATINADMKVGALEETITVTGGITHRRCAERPAADHAHQRNADDGAERTILVRRCVALSGSDHSGRGEL